MNTTTIDEIEDGIYRIQTGVDVPSLSAGFSFNQYLVVDDNPLLFHTGPRRLFASTADAVKKVIPLNRLRWIGFSHFEADECGALNDFLAASPQAEPICSQVASMVSVDDIAIRPSHPLSDGEVLEIGRRRVRWLDTPHLPHAWECGYLFEEVTGTLFCGDLFTQPGALTPAVTDGDILGPSEAMRKGLDYFSHSRNASMMIGKLADTNPKLLACMHGSAYRGNARGMLESLALALCKE